MLGKPVVISLLITFPGRLICRSRISWKGGSVFAGNSGFFDSVNVSSPFWNSHQFSVSRRCCDREWHILRTPPLQAEKIRVVSC